jgi:hypothetical protein
MTIHDLSGGLLTRAAMTRYQWMPPYGKNRNAIVRISGWNLCRDSKDSATLKIIHAPTRWGLMRVELKDGSKAYLSLQSRILNRMVSRWLTEHGNNPRALVGRYVRFSTGEDHRRYTVCIRSTP